jgi:SHS2 domain-containing protein
MPYEFLGDIAIADAAFEARGNTPEELFVAAADATLNVMVSDLSTIGEKESRTFHLQSDAFDLLLFEMLQEIIFYKDAERLLLRVPTVVIRKGDDGYTLEAKALGEEIDPSKHDLIVDVKAVTLHRFRVEETPSGWEATVILDT